MITSAPLRVLRTSPARVVLAGLAAIGIAGAGCGSSNTTPTSPTSVVTNASIENFVGTISAAQTVFYSFVVAQPLTVGLTLASLTNTAGDTVLGVSEKLGLGIPAGPGCGAVTSVIASPGLTAQLVAPLQPGTYCVYLTDTAGLSADANFAIRITQGTLALVAKTSPEKFESLLNIKGSAAQTFVAPSAGVATATLDALTPSASVNLGLGVWQFEKTACKITQVATGGAGTQISLPVDPGVYCVRVFDTGTLTDVVSFSISVIHP